MYWRESVAEQVKKLMAANKKLSRRQATSIVVGSARFVRTNPPQPRFSGAKEIARRAMQIKKGFKIATA